jgi:alkylation response protein AidB-like acyl-CoA dehydrogenase
MVDFETTETQKQIVGTAHDFGKDVAGPAEFELDRMPDPNETFKSDTFWKVLGQAFELGFHKMAIPEELGGLGLTPQTIGMVWEEFGRWAPGIAASLIPGAIVPQLISFLAPDNKELVDKYVVPYCEDTKADLISGWCSSEPEVGSDGKNYYDPNVRHHTGAKKTDTGWSITGTKSGFISNGGIAHVLVVFACVDPSMGLRGSGTFVAPGDAPGVTRGKALDKIGLRALNQTEVFFDDVEIPEDYMIFPPGEQYPMLHHAIVTVGNLGVGYLAVGLMRAAYEEALEHSKTRVQWGKPIFEHQLIAEKLMKCYQAIESARAFLWKGSWLSTKNFPGDLKTSLAAKIYATEQAVHHTSEMVQVFGGYGISKEYNVEKYSRDAKLLRIMDGTNETLLFTAAAEL